MSDANAEQAAFWEERASSWLAGERQLTKVAERFGRHAADRLELEAGQSVVDIGCGSGPTTRDLAHRVGPTGRATGFDISPALVAAAQRAAAEADVTNIEFRVADVQTGEIGEGQFDAAFSRFGVMFFSDPVVAFTQIRRALRPGGRFAFACWQNLFLNEWMLVPGSAVIAVTGVLPPMPGPDDPGPFFFAEPGRVETVLGAAGFTDVTVEEVNETIVWPASEVASVSTMSHHIGPVREALRDADSDTATQIRQAVDDALAARIVDDELALSAAVFVVSARA
jgi:SAM-dependent methyltransferase